MHIQIKRRPPVAQFLTKKMHDDRWSVPELSSVANVTETYVSYLMNFATEETQIWFLLEQMRLNQRSKCKKQILWVDVPPEVKDKLGQFQNTSAKVQEIFHSWRNDENRIRNQRPDDP